MKKAHLAKANCAVTSRRLIYLFRRCGLARNVHSEGGGGWMASERNSPIIPKIPNGRHCISFLNVNLNLWPDWALLEWYFATKFHAQVVLIFGHFVLWLLRKLSYLWETAMGTFWETSSTKLGYFFCTHLVTLPAPPLSLTASKESFRNDNIRCGDFS